MENDVVQSFREDLARLKESVGCWGVVAGSGAGSMVSLKFGGKTEKIIPSRNSTLSEDLRKYEAEYSLFLQHCDWRLQRSSEVLASSASSNHEGGPMLAALHQIVGQRVMEVEVDFPSFDLKMEFENGVRLIVFCFGNSTDDWDNYIFSTHSSHYSSTFDRGFVKEAREPV